jgi:hypothetical protein
MGVIVITSEDQWAAEVAKAKEAGKVVRERAEMRCARAAASDRQPKLPRPFARIR